MGTNYYVKNKMCQTCKHRPESIHLGKSSGGWQFSFQYNGGEYYKNVREMKIWLKGKRIYDEYERRVSYKEFWKMVEDKQTDSNKNHAKEVGTTGEDFIIDGYSFSDCRFS